MAKNAWKYGWLMSYPKGKRRRALWRRHLLPLRAMALPLRRPRHGARDPRLRPDDPRVPLGELHPGRPDHRRATGEPTPTPSPTPTPVPTPAATADRHRAIGCGGQLRSATAAQPSAARRTASGGLLGIDPLVFAALGVAVVLLAGIAVVARRPGAKPRVLDVLDACSAVQANC